MTLMIAKVMVELPYIGLKILSSCCFARMWSFTNIWWKGFTWGKIRASEQYQYGWFCHWMSTKHFKNFIFFKLWWLDIRLKSFINTKKALKKLYIFILRRFRLFLIHLQSKNKATLRNASNSKPKDSVTQEITVWCKRCQKQNLDRQPCQIR